MKNVALGFLWLIWFYCPVFGEPGKRPNILFAVADDMSHTGCYGWEFVETPHFDSLADAGLKFTRMYTPSSKCSPSRAVMLTGRNPWQLEEAANHWPVWPVKFKTVVEELADSGYFTGYTGKGWGPGILPKGRTLTGKEYNEVRVMKSPLKVSPYDYTANFRKFMADKPEDVPFFFWYGCKEPHRGYAFKSGVGKGKKLEDLDFLPSFWSGSAAVKHDILDYAVEVEYFDRHLGAILGHLEALGELENTLVIATSDNSMPFPRFKGHPHEFATRVPFVVQWPGRIEKPGRVCGAFASFIDLAPTFLEAAGVKGGGMSPVQGKSLFDFFADKVTARDYVLTGRERNDMCRPDGLGYPVRSLHKGDYVYMHNFEPERWPCGTPEGGYRDTDGSPTKSDVLGRVGTDAWELCYGKRPKEELYNVGKDPECLVNLAKDPEYDAMRAEMKRELFSELKDQGDPRQHGRGGFFDACQPDRHGKYDDLVTGAGRKNKSNNNK